MDAERVINLRKAMRLTQEDFAERIGSSKNTVYNYENGSKIPTSKITILENLESEIFKISRMKLEVNEDSAKYISEYKGVPYYDVDFTAGFIEVENNNQTKPDSYVNHPFFKGCDYVVRASGQSMAKVICHGDAIGLIKLSNWKEFFPFGEIYAIVTHDGFRMVKVVTKGESEDTFTLISKPTDNKKDEFPPQQIKINQITTLFKVQASSHLF